MSFLANSSESLQVALLQPESAELNTMLDEIWHILPGDDQEKTQGVQKLRMSFYGNQGLVLLRGSQPLAIVLYYLKGASCRVIFAYALKKYNQTKLLVQLIKSLVELAKEDRAVNSLRFDMVAWFPDSVAQALRLCGFAKADRLLMRRPCSANDLQLHQQAYLPSGMELVPWNTWLTKPAAEMLYYIFSKSYEGKWDRDLTELNGCRLFMSDCYAGRFGDFDASVTFALQYRNLWAGLAVATRNEANKGFIPTFGLLPNFVGQGLGKIMLKLLIYRYAKSTSPPEALELAVSEANIAAMKLYKQHGFVAVNRFQVYYLNL